MILKQSLQQIFVQLSQTLNELSIDEYRQPSKVLLNATIGQHVRHIIELYICLYNGYETGVVNYDKRKRDIRIETDKDLAIELMEMITSNLDKFNKDLLLVASYDNHAAAVPVATNYYREIIYNLEHTVHHMALVRVGIHAVSTIAIPDDFGVASSTLKYRKECAP